MISASWRTGFVRARPLHLAAAVSGGATAWRCCSSLLGLQPEVRLYAFCLPCEPRGLRGQSADRDEAFVRAECARLGCRCGCSMLQRWPTPPPSEHAGGGLGAPPALCLLWNAFVRGGIDVVATAHTANDQAETLLLLAGAGTGLHGAGWHPAKARVLPAAAAGLYPAGYRKPSAGQPGRHGSPTRPTRPMPMPATGCAVRPPALQSTNGAAAENLARFCEKGAAARRCLFCRRKLAGGGTPGCGRLQNRRRAAGDGVCRQQTRCFWKLRCTSLDGSRA